MNKGAADRAVLIREKMLILGLVNIYQPVKLARVSKGLARDFDPRRLRRAANALRKEGMLTSVKGGRYLVTRRGRDILSTERYARERDINRMLYLYEGSKGGRETA